jgi:hypothetical protein
MLDSLGIMQPYFLPYIGYFQLIHSVDTFVLYDDVNFIKKGWINRNNILVNGAANLFSIPLVEASQNKKINEILIDPSPVWKNKLLKNIEQNYKKAPEFNNFYPILHKIIDYKEPNLALYIYNSITELVEYMGIDTKILLSSSTFTNQHLKAQDRIIDCCKTLQTEEYVNAIGGQELYRKEDFDLQKIKLKFIKTNNITYKQYKAAFVPYLSIIDLLFFCTKETTQQILNAYEFV